MNKVVRFSKIRFYMIALSVVLIVSGGIGTYVRGGFNLGIEFLPGLSQRVQVAPVAVELTYDRAAEARLNVVGGTVQLNIVEGDDAGTWEFPVEDYPTIGELAEGLNSIPGVSAEAAVDPGRSTEDIVTGIGLPYILGEVPVHLNVRNIDTQDYIQIDQMRSALSGFDALQVQVAGTPSNQEFLVRVQQEGEVGFEEMEARIASLIEGQFGENTLVVKQSDFVGPQYSEALVRQSIMLIGVALLLILAYVWFRFKLGFALSSISALAHDIIFMLMFIGALQIEVNTATIAAVLTIIGYSLNDTIVIFDRIRENTGIMKEKPFKLIVDTSITRSMRRTLITSLTTLLAVTALYIFGSGMIQDFALNLIVGVVVGTYSSIFIASPVLIGWVQRAKRKEAKHLGRVFNEDLDPVGEDARKAAAAAAPKQKAQAPSQGSTAKETEIPKIERKPKGKRKKKKK